MKKVILTSLIVMMVAGITFAAPEGTPDGYDRLYKFNIIGVDNPKNNMDQGSGKVIFVNLNEPSQINLVCSDDQDVLDMYPDLEEGSFDILDKDATDSGKDDPSPGAILALPDPGLDPYIIGERTDEDVWSAYSIYIRPLGKQGGFANITTCAEVLETFGPWLDKGDFKIINRAGAFGGVASVESVGQTITERPKGKSVFTNVTAQLLTIVLEVEIGYLDLTDPENPVWVVTDVVYVRIPIFNNMLQGEYWEYDNHGLKNLQVWIYNNETNVAEDDETNYPGEF
ncbi:MAG: hypothetical protein WBC05_04035 [Sedimentisphaerales bacterium]